MNEMTMPLDKKNIAVTAKRQITIPLKFFKALHIGKEVECILHKDELILRPLKERQDDFSEYILQDLIAEGYSGQELLNEFKRRKANIRPAVSKMLQDAREVAEGKQKGYTIADVFGDDND